jgi:hypothetical protein
MSTSLGSVLSRSVRGGRRGGGGLCLQPPREEEGAAGSQGAAVSERRGGGQCLHRADASALQLGGLKRKKGILVS